jgi:hypothetical protein
MRASRQWQDMETRQHFGFAHDKDKIPGDGDLADFCPACAQPGINLPENWHEQNDQLVTFLSWLLFGIAVHPTLQMEV